MDQQQVLKYAYLSKAAYDAYDDEHHGACRYGLRRLLPAVGLADHGYVATAFLYSTVSIVPGVDRDDHQHWIGFVAVADDAERDRAGYRDIAVVWRGTDAPDERFKDLEAFLVPIHGGEGSELGGATPPAPAPADVRVEAGFQSLYASGCAACEVRGSARSQVLGELRRLVSYFGRKRPGEKVHVTATGHSLGGALAMLTAWDAAGTGVGAQVVSAVTFGAPRMGNGAFCDELVNSRGVAVRRVVVKQDVVPMMPLACMGYADAGDDVLRLDADTPPCPHTSQHKGLFPWFTFHGPWHYHSLNMYLRLLDRNYCEMLTPAAPAPEMEKDSLPLEESELDQMVSSVRRARARI